MCSVRLILLVLVLTIGSILEQTAPEVSAQVGRKVGSLQVRWNRQQFARAMARVKEGMSEQQVHEILGRPDAKGGVPFTWSYGRENHEPFGTLGAILFDVNDRVEKVVGQGSPPKEGMFTEEELRRLLLLIDTAPELRGYKYNPLSVIRIVNALQPLGKEKALAAISEYLRVTLYRPAYEGLFLVLRALFDVPDDPGYMLPMYVGAPDPPEPADRRRIPRFPLAIQDGIPFLLVSGYARAGRPRFVGEHIAYFRTHGRLRVGLLTPSDRPFDAVAHLEQTSQWIWSAAYKTAYRAVSNYDARDEVEERKLLWAQALRMLDTVYHVNVDYFGQPASPKGKEAQLWDEIRRNVAKLDIGWNATQGNYTVRDGSDRRSESAR